jgi:uncharacterized membrane protein
MFGVVTLISKEKKNTHRIWEVDFLRGLLVVGMIILHILYDLEEFYGAPINYSGGIVNVVGKIVASLFIFISGLSTNFSRSSFKRGVIVFFSAMLVTLISYFFNPEIYVVFGILHFIGICMIVSPLLKKIPTASLFILSFVLVSTVFVIPHIHVSGNYLFMFGIYNRDFFSADYYPLLPWSWLFVAGMASGRLIYRQKKSIFKFSVNDNLINIIGRNSLIVYLVHQPVVLALLTLFMKLF